MLIMLALDGFDPEIESYIPVEERKNLDRWILSKMSSVAMEYHSDFVNWNCTQSMQRS